MPFRVSYTILISVCASLMICGAATADWLPETMIFGPGSAYYSIQMEAEGDNIHIAFFGNGPDFLGEVGYLRSTDQGLNWNEPHFFTLYGSGRTGSYPLLQIWQNKIMVTWRDYGGNYHNYNIGYSISYNRGEDWTAPDYVLDPGHEGITGLNTCNFENDIHVVFSLSDGYSKSVYYLKSTDFGQSWSDEDSLFTFHRAEDGDIVAFGDYVHYFFGGWPYDTNMSELYYIRSSNSGATWSDPVVISHDDGYSSRWPRAAVNNLGYVAVIWRDLRSINNRPMRGFYITVSTDNGSSWSEPVRVIPIPAGFSDEKEIIWDQNTLHMIWQDTSDFWIPYYRILYSYSDDFGQSWAVADTVDSNYLYDSKNPNIASSDGQLYAVWRDDMYIVEDDGMYFSRYQEETGNIENQVPDQKQISLEIYPNPFNSDINISYRNLGSDKIEIFNIIGRKIKSFDIDPRVDGNIIWSGRDENNEPISSGVYFLRTTWDNAPVNRKILYLK